MYYFVLGVMLDMMVVFRSNVLLWPIVWGEVDMSVSGNKTLEKNLHIWALG